MPYAARPTHRLLPPRRVAAVPVTLLLGVLLTSVLTACGGDDEIASTQQTTSCDFPDSGVAAKAVDAPDSTVPLAGDVPVTIDTSIGTLQATLDSDRTPCTVASFRSLASQGYFDGTSCHRLVTDGIFVLQCGDPTGSGSGGPGYSFADELTGDETYPAGTLAMANAGPDTNGSQFFMVYRDSPLPPSYTVFGTVDSASVAVLQQLASQGTADKSTDGAPAVEVDITKVS